MTNQVVTIDYLKTFVNGVVSVNTTKSDSYCPTYAELTGGTLVQNYSTGSNPTNHTPGISIPSCSVDVGYNDNQLVTRQDLKLLWYVLQSVDVSASPTTISCCGGSSTLSTTAYFKLHTKNEDETIKETTNKSVTVSASYSDEKTYTTINGAKITFDKNSVDYPTYTSADARSSSVKSTYTYSGITKTDTVTITQNSNSVGNWTWISDTTTSISVSPSSMSFESGGGTKSYSVTRYYKSYYEKYDSCSKLMDTTTDNNSVGVTPTSYECDGDFTCTSNEVSCETNTGSARSGTLTVTWGSFSDTCSLSQGASQAGTTNGEPYDYDYYLYVTVASSYVGCEGGTATFSAYYVTTWKYDWETKNDAGEVTNNGTSSDSSSTNVTSSAEWSTTLGTVSSSGKLTLGAYDSDTRRTATVTAKYNGYSDSETAYQESCYEEPEDTGSTSCMTVTYTLETGAATTVYFKTTNGTQQGSHEVDATGSQQLCCYNLDGTTLVASTNDSDVTLDGDTTFVYEAGSEVYIGLKKSGGGGGGDTPSTTCVIGNTITSNGGNGTKVTVGKGGTKTLTIYTKEDGMFSMVSVVPDIYDDELVSIQNTASSQTEYHTTWLLTASNSKTGSTDITFKNGCGEYVVPFEVTASTPSFTPYYVFEIKIKDSSDDYTTALTLNHDTSVTYDLSIRTRYYTGSGANDYTVINDYVFTTEDDWITIPEGGKGYNVSSNHSGSDRTGTVTITQTPSGKKIYLYITQKDVSCTVGTVYDGFVYTYTSKLDKCATGHDIKVSSVGYTTTNQNCTTSSGHVDITNDNVTITVTPAIAKNETAQEKTYTYTIKGKGIYSGVTSTGTLTQNAGPCTPVSTVYQYKFKNCYTDRNIGLFASNATPSGAHTQYAMLSARDGTEATVLVTSNNGTMVNGSSSSMGGTAKIGDKVKVYSVNNSNVWTLEETITLTAFDRSFSYGNCNVNPLYVEYNDTTKKLIAKFDEMVASDVTVNIRYTLGGVNSSTSLTVQEGNNQASKTLQITQSVTTTAGTSLTVTSVAPASDAEYNYDGDITTKIIPSTEKPIVSQIYIQNNCPGSVNLEYTGPTGGKQYKTLEANSSGSYNIVLSGQSDFQVSVPDGHYNRDSSNFIYVEFRDGEGGTLPFNVGYGNTRDEGGGCKAMPDFYSSNASSASICTTNTQYQVCATIIFAILN